jgi:hypothetical protein
MGRSCSTVAASGTDVAFMPVRGPPNVAPDAFEARDTSGTTRTRRKGRGLFIRFGRVILITRDNRADVREVAAASAIDRR